MDNAQERVVLGDDILSMALSISSPVMSGLLPLGGMARTDK